MRMATVSVFVKRTRYGWDASTHNAEATHPTSATLAARRAAAKHFLVQEVAVDLVPSTEHVMIASVRTDFTQPVEPAPSKLLVATIALVIGLTCAISIIAARGGR